MGTFAILRLLSRSRFESSFARFASFSLSTMWAWYWQFSTSRRVLSWWLSSSNRAASFALSSSCIFLKQSQLKMLDQIMRPNLIQALSFSWYKRENVFGTFSIYLKKIILELPSIFLRLQSMTCRRIPQEDIFVCLKKTVCHNLSQCKKDPKKSLANQSTISTLHTRRKIFFFLSIHYNLAE